MLESSAVDLRLVGVVIDDRNGVVYATTDVSKDLYCSGAGAIE